MRPLHSLRARMYASCASYSVPRVLMVCSELLMVLLLIVLFGMMCSLTLVRQDSG